MNEKEKTALRQNFKNVGNLIDTGIDENGHQMNDVEHMNEENEEMEKLINDYDQENEKIESPKSNMSSISYYGSERAETPSNKRLFPADSDDEIDNLVKKKRKTKSNLNNSNISSNTILSFSSTSSNSSSISSSLSSSPVNNSISNLIKKSTKQQNTKCKDPIGDEIRKLEENKKNSL